MESVFNVHNQHSILAITSGGSNDVGTVTTTTKTNSYSSYTATLFNDIELDSSTLFTLSGDDEITFDVKNGYAYGNFYTGSGDDVIRITNEVGAGTWAGRVIGLTAQGGSGNDELHGGAGEDELKGNSGNDLIYGGGGDDFLYGDCRDYDFSICDYYDVAEHHAGGIDTIYGGDGNDGGAGDARAADDPRDDARHLPRRAARARKVALRAVGGDAVGKSGARVALAVDPRRPAAD